MRASSIDGSDKGLNSSGSACTPSMELPDCPGGKHSKSFQGILPGGQLPGAFDIPTRARGEIPSWGLRQDEEDGSEHDEEDGVDDVERQDGGPALEGTLDANSTNAVDVAVAVAAVLSRDPRDDLLVIEGVKTMDPRVRHFCILLGVLVVASLLSVAAAMITTRLRSRPAASPGSPLSNETLDPSFHPNDQNATMVPTATFSPLGNLSITMADKFTMDEATGLVTLNPFLSPLLKERFLASANRTDANFTVFTVKPGAKLLAGLSMAVLSKMVTPLWLGHVMDASENLFVEGQLIAIEDMYDGMVLTSLSGYPLIIQLNPLRVNNVSISPESRNEFYKNGVIHTLLEYPNPLGPWIGKSMSDVLLDTNDRRGGDLSRFLELIAASSALQSMLELHPGDTSAITLFAPTNDAWAALDSAALQQLLLNHVVSGNFARRFWTDIPTGTKVSDTELILETYGGQELHLQILANKHVPVMINANVTILTGDIFSEQGILHIVDKVLL